MWRTIPMQYCHYYGRKEMEEFLKIRTNQHMNEVFVLAKWRGVNWVNEQERGSKVFHFQT